ncbi:hypothetical protein JYU08_00125 [bacterium AH-315-B06]|nr:hypothetical protein [bacterium AH-315-B06]
MSIGNHQIDDDDTQIEPPVADDYLRSRQIFKLNRSPTLAEWRQIAA